MTIPDRPRRLARILMRLGYLLVLSGLCFLARQAPLGAQALLTSQAGALQERLASYPHWSTLPPIGQRKGEIHYPDWLAGTWRVNSTLVEQLAPLAPAIVSPGFEKNQGYVAQPVTFTVKFDQQIPLPEFTWALSDLVQTPTVVLPDRRFNALAITRAYLGKDLKFSVQVIEQPMPHIVTIFGQKKRLAATIIGHNQQAPRDDEFIATELSSQQFVNGDYQYLNQVETTTDYQLQQDGTIAATQITAVYLSPQDPDYFSANNQPIALYRYQLTLTPLAPEGAGL